MTDILLGSHSRMAIGSNEENLSEAYVPAEWAAAVVVVAMVVVEVVRSGGPAGWGRTICRAPKVGAGGSAAGLDVCGSIEGCCVSFPGLICCPVWSGQSKPESVQLDQVRLR